MMMAAAALAMAGCSNDENEVMDNWNGEIRLTSGLEVQQTETRGITTDLQTTQIAQDNHVGFFINEEVASGETATTTYTPNLDYTANGNYVVTWVFNWTPAVDDWRAGVVDALTQYTVNGGSWDNVKTAFVDGWATQYAKENG